MIIFCFPNQIWAERNISYDFVLWNAENTFFNLTNFTICMSSWYIDAFYDSVLWLWLDRNYVFLLLPCCLPSTCRETLRNLFANPYDSHLYDQLVLSASQILHGSLAKDKCSFQCRESWHLPLLSQNCQVFRDRCLNWRMIRKDQVSNRSWSSPSFGWEIHDVRLLHLPLNP